MKALRILKDTVAGLIEDNVTMHCAALAYYTLFSVAPLLIISIAIAGFFFGEAASRGEIYIAIRSLLGDSGAHAIEGLVHGAAQDRHTGVIATWIGGATLFFGASGVFSQLEESLNLIWKIQVAKGKGLVTFLRRRLLTFSMVLVIGFLLLVSLVASAALAAVGAYLGSRLPGGETFWHAANFLFSFAVITFLFAAIFKILPDVRLAWGDVWAGAAMTAFLFAIGKLGIGLYLGKSTVASTYGAAGSLVIVLLWVYYSAMILFFGAEFTRVLAGRRGKRALPKSGAEYVNACSKNAA